jgi:hypothetical protein
LETIERRSFDSNLRNFLLHRICYKKCKKNNKILHCKKAATFPSPMVNFDVEKATIGW